MLLTASVAAGLHGSAAADEPAVIQTATLADGQVDAAYSQTLTATGGRTPYTWAVTSGAVPAGLTLSSAGTLSGTPTTAAGFTFSVVAIDALDVDSEPREFTVTIIAAPGGGGPATVTKPTVIYGSMSWVGVEGTNNLTRWNKAKAAGGDGWLLSKGWLPGYGGDLPQWVLDLPGNPGLTNMKWGLSFYGMTYNNAATPFMPWWSDSDWANLVDTWANCCEDAYDNGYELFGVDLEPYQNVGTPGDEVWSATHTANLYGKTVAETRAKVKARATQVVQACVDAVGADTLRWFSYYQKFPGTWSENVYQWATAPFPNTTVNHDDNLFVDLCEGFAAAIGLLEYDVVDATYHKAPQGEPAPTIGEYWSHALNHDLAAHRALFSTWVNGDKCHFVPFGWPDEQFPTGFTAYRGRNHVEGQFAAFKDAVIDPTNYAPMVVMFEYSNFVLDPEFGYGHGEASPGALNLYGKFSRRLGTAPAAY